MGDLLERKRADLLGYHTANGFINVRKMRAGERVLIKTPEEVYEFEVGTPELGVVLLASDIRFENRDKAVLTGSLDPETNIFLEEIIGEGLKIALRLGNRIMYISPVVYAKVSGDNYEYVLWERE